VESIEEIIRLREEAVQKLLEEKEHLESELSTLKARLKGIDEQLGRLGYVTDSQVSSSATSWQRGTMEDGLYQGKYKGQTYTLHVQNGVGTIDGIEEEFHSLSAAAKNLRKAVTGRETRGVSGPRFWKKVD